MFSWTAGIPAKKSSMPVTARDFMLLLRFKRIDGFAWQVSPYRGGVLGVSLRGVGQRYRKRQAAAVLEGGVHCLTQVIVLGQ